MSSVKGGGALPVRQTSTLAVQGGPAKRVYGYPGTPGDRPAIGGPAQRVKVLTDVDLTSNGGRYVLEGDPVAMPIYDAPAGTSVMGGPVMPVYLVGGSLLRVDDIFLLEDGSGYWLFEDGSRITWG